jgi:hypothetical protein
MPRGKTQAVLTLIDVCRDILEEIQPASVRAVCYQLFVQGLIEDMSKRCTNRISRHLVYAREHNIVPWNWMVDDTRAVERIHVWGNPAAFVRTVKRRSHRDHWASQAVIVAIVGETNTVQGPLAPVAIGGSLTVRHPPRGEAQVLRSSLLADQGDNDGSGSAG